MVLMSSEATLPGLAVLLELVVPALPALLPLILGFACIVALFRMRRLRAERDSNAWHQRLRTATQLFTSGTATGRPAGLAMMEHLAIDRRAAPGDVSLANGLLSQWRSAQNLGSSSPER